MYKKGEIHILVAIIISFLVVGAIVGTVGGGLYVANKIKNADTTPIVKSEPVATSTSQEMSAAETATTSTSTVAVTSAPAVATPKPVVSAVVVPKPPVVTSTITDSDLVAARATIEGYKLANQKQDEALMMTFFSTKSIEFLTELRKLAEEAKNDPNTIKSEVNLTFYKNIVINNFEKKGTLIIAKVTETTADNKTQPGEIPLTKENGVWKIGVVEALQAEGAAFEAAQESIDPNLPFSLTVTDVKFSSARPIVNDPEFTIFITFKNTGSRVPIGGLYSYVELDGVFSTGVNIGSLDATFYPGESIVREYKPYSTIELDRKYGIGEDDVPGKKILKIKYNENGTRENPPAPSTDKFFTKEFEVFAN